MNDRIYQILERIKRLKKTGWKDVVGFEGLYIVNSYGNVRGLKRKVRSGKRLMTVRSRAITAKPNEKGYVEVYLSKNGKLYKTYQHIILAKAFLPNPDDKPTVNHKNGLKADNRLENLEWATYKENALHALENGLRKCKPVLNRCTGEIFSSARSAASSSKLSLNTIRKYLSNKTNNRGCLEFISAKAA